MTLLSDETAVRKTVGRHIAYTPAVCSADCGPLVNWAAQN